jgi:glycerophosphoryl diester phosphodiesterase
MKRLPLFRNPASRSLLAALFLTSLLQAAPGTFTFSNPANRLAAASGTATLAFWDPDTTDWATAGVAFGSASSFGLPGMTGGDPQVMSFPALTNRQGLLLTHGALPNGSFADSPGLVSNYTLIYDVLYPAASDAKWRSLLQTSMGNGDDGEFFVDNTPSGGVGINSNYRGRIIPGQWHRIAISVRAAAGEGQAQRYIDGQFVGAIGTTGSALADRFGLGTEALLLADNDGETAPGYLAGFYFNDRAMNADEISALGGPHADGPNVPGSPAPAYTEKMARRVKAIGHRGGSFGSAPDNSLTALRKAFQEGAAGVEVDTRLTADGVALCFHDANLDRTTNGSGPVESATLAEVKMLDAGSKFDPSFAGEKVPTLAEVLTEAKGKGIVYLDIKTGGQAQAFADAIAASTFPLADLWFWTPGDPAYAEEIRMLIPGAQIVWGSPDASWSTDPDYFINLRNLGVIGFSIGNGTGTPDLAFATRAKQEGFFVEVYTINDPDTMRRCAAAGVDYMETDFPATLVALQPPVLAKASGPLPAMGASVTAPSTVLRWITGENATAHRIHFGTVNPPPFVRQQTSDLYQTPVFAAGQTYYWRIDEVTSSGTVTGDVWSFTTPAPANGNRLEWEFNGSLASAMGGGSLTFSDGANTEALCAFETTDGVNVPDIAGDTAGYLRLPGFTSREHGLSLFLTGIAANGGGTNVNRYSLIFDVNLPFPGSWFCFFNTDPNNNNDGDFFLNGSRALGIGALGYSGNNVITPGTWHRVIFSADLPSGTVTTYVDGTLVRTRTGAALTDQRFALYPGSAAGSHLRLFNDEDGETSEVLVSAFAFTDVPLSATQALELGSPRAEGIFYSPPAALPPLTLQRSGNNIVITWPAAATRRLQRATGLSGWVDVPGTTGFGTWTETIVPGSRVFFRAVE